MESGAGSFWTYADMRDAYHNFDKAAESTGCHTPGAATGGIDDVIGCMVDAPTEVVAAALGPDVSGSGFRVYCRDGCAWAPVVDGALVRGRPLDLARAGLIRPHTPLIAGHNLNDGAGFVPKEGWDEAYLGTRKQLLEYFGR
eukprot:435998-Prymnesium_polylepis.1